MWEMGPFHSCLSWGKHKTSKVNLFFSPHLDTLSSTETCSTDSEERWHEELQFLAEQWPENKCFPNSAVTRAQVTGGESHQSQDALIFVLLCSLENLLLATGEERKREQACMSCLDTHPAFPGTGGNSTIILACSVAIWGWTVFLGGYN